MGPNGSVHGASMCIRKRKLNMTSKTTEITVKFSSTIKTGSTHYDLRHGGEVCYGRLNFVIRSFVERCSTYVSATFYHLGLHTRAERKKK